VTSLAGDAARWDLARAAPTGAVSNVRQETPVRRALLALAALAVVGGATAASAAPPPVPVYVTHNDDGSVCVTISEQLPHCTPPANVVH